jgi:hypothetical protein
LIEKKKIAVFHQPDSHDDISRLVNRLLNKADAFDVLPTPMGRLFEVARIKEVGKLPDPEGGFVKTLGDQARATFLRAMQKIRGIADLRARVVYVPRRDHDPRILFAQGHELGHQCMEWHNVNRAYQDDDYSLSYAAKVLLEREANYFSADTVFQGSRFVTRARDYTAEFSSIFHLATNYGASIQATTWRFIEDQDYPVAALYYYPNNRQIDEFGNPLFTLWKVAASPKFKKLCEGFVDLPLELRNGDAWLEAKEIDRIISGMDEVDCGANGSIKFIWQAWWNSHALIVLLRRKPLLRIL